MRDDNDITSLYREFGGDPRNYREIGREDRAHAARGRWPLLSRIRPGQASVPPAAGDSPADRPAQAVAWPLAPGAAVSALPLSRFSPVRRGAAVDAAKVAALIRGARVQRPPLDALEIPRPPLRETPPAPAAEPVVAAPVAAAAVEPRISAPVAAPAPPVAAPRAPVAAEPPARPAPKVLIEPTLAPERPAAIAPEPASAATPLQGVFARLARTARADATQDPPSSKAAKK
ncbi:cellulose biosynthesis protein BcsP [Achromobacter insuavis]|uniref:cellulose biosynthesis protein BcsP n=1 Tax=Achromobacter insuavis TaxID=1287735 RepID=UPI001F145973|nr:cellulose biosynthesis protein BcsP [Achromobacter insuavis]